MELHSSFTSSESEQEDSGISSADRHLTTRPNSPSEAAAREEELLIEARSGSHAAFAELQKAYSRLVYARILTITRNHADAEDALQDTFLSAYLALPSFEGKSKLSSWLVRIGINSALMILRRRRYRPEMPFEQQSESEGDGSYPDIRDDALDPEQLYDQQQRCHAIRCALQRLDPKLRTTLSIRLWEDPSMKELAQDLGTSVASVKSRLYRARKRLLRSPAIGIGRPPISSHKKVAVLTHTA
jgi:RNA polymerase sigma-70 factor (ECF subfamily)